MNATERVNTSVFELVDVTDCETYYTSGVWPSLEAAIAAVEECNDDPCKLGEQAGCMEECISFEIRERALGWSGIGKTVWKRTWVSDWEDDQDVSEQKWRIVSELTDPPKEVER